MKKRLPIIILVLAAVAAYVYYQKQHPAFTYAGSIEVDEVDVQPGVASPVGKLLVQEGQLVTEGQRLAELTCPDVRVAAGQALSDYSRNARLFEAGSMAASNFDRSLYANRDARVKLAWCDVESPISGTVMTIYRRVGEWARPGQAILTLADLSSVYAYFYVPSTLVAQLKLGQAVKCSLPELPGRAFQGSLAYIRPEAEFTPKNVQTREERERLVFGVKVHFDNPDGTLKPGMTIEADLPKTAK